ncbi:interleukin-12 receptor subunit beta-2 isoform X1 [Strix aluco]|uniref:interleukin-12 receptor subunit beta-2 isoform X1 n=1 Tax=Strix aluco TaxID=111821 RepID=UPI003DA4F0B5
MLFAWIVPTAIWLLVHFTAEACSKGNVPASKCPRGAAEICDKGTMTANTTSHVQPGTSISLLCQLKPLQYSEQCKIAIFFNSSELISNYGSSVSTGFLVRTYGKHMFTCKRVCQSKKRLICGIDIESGNPPDEPKNVSCIQYGTDSHPTCTWDKGRLTYINTTYVIQLSNGTDVLCVSEGSLNKKFGSLALSKLNFDSTYTVVVAASNELGSAFSQPLVFMLIDIGKCTTYYLSVSPSPLERQENILSISCSNLSEKPSVQSKPVTLFPPVLSCAAYLSAVCFFLFLLLVKPHPPNFLVEFENSSATNCTFFWHDEAQAQHWRLRYRPLTRHTWSTVESLNSEKCSLYGLEPHTAYEFQVSCKIHPERGLWSNWRTYQTQTPEAVPTGLLDVWYRQQDVDSQQQNISLFWKALSRSEARGRILRYTVTFEALGTRSPPAGEVHVTTQTSLTRVIPRVGYKITVTAENSRGRSPPASIMTDLGTQDLPPPQKVSAVATGNSSIFVSWKAPVASAAAVSGYVVEWADTPRSPRPEPCPAWVKLPASNLSTVIAEHIKDNVCYQISVFALYRDRAGQAASVRGYSRAKAPSAGPRMYTTPWANGILVSWEAIPVSQQRGCITGYRIYLQKNDGQAAPEVYSRYLVKTNVMCVCCRWGIEEEEGRCLRKAPVQPGSHRQPVCHEAVSNVSAPRSLHITELQPDEPYTLWMTASTAAGEGPWGNTQLLCLESAGHWMAVVLTCSFLIILACMCYIPPARKLLHSLLSVLVPQWQSKAIPDPANATWAKNYLSMKPELSLPPSLFLHSTGSFEEPETTQVEETLVKTEPPALRDKLLFGSGGNGDWPPASGPGQEELGYRALPSPADGEVYEQQLPDPYKRIAVEEHTQTVSEYITNPITDTAAVCLPPATGATDHLPELDCNPLAIFPTTFLTPILSCEGNLTLDTVKINCSSFTM